MKPLTKVQVKESKNLEMRIRKDAITGKKPTTIIKRSAKKDTEINTPEGINMMEPVNIPEELIIVEQEPIHQPEKLPELPSKIGLDTDRAPEIALPQVQNPVDFPGPPIEGFDLANASRIQQHAIRSMVVLCDCCVQRDAEGIFDVLCRNHYDANALIWWLRKIGKPLVAEHIKGKDIVDGARKAAYELFRELKKEIGRPISRW